MKKAEAISILATSVRPREAKDRERYDKAVNMAIEALKAQEPKNVPDTNVGDMISRQAAINYCYTLINVEHEQGTDEMNYGQERVNQTETILHHLEFMPSVQPEIVPCGDCKHWICHDRRCGYWNHGVKPLEWCCHAERKENR